MVTTKKFLSALKADGRAGQRGAFVMPDPEGGTHFVELQTGKRHDQAYVVFTGVNRGSEDVVSKASALDAPSDRLLRLAESFLTALRGFKVGNVLAVAENDGEAVMLSLVSNCPKPDAGPALPG